MPDTNTFKILPWKPLKKLEIGFLRFLIVELLYFKFTSLSMSMQYTIYLRQLTD